SRRRLWVSTTSTNRTRKVAVGTVKKSKAIRSAVWLFKNVRHACDGGLRGRPMYFDTVACETVRPSFNSSPWILGAPHTRIARAEPSPRRVAAPERDSPAQTRGACEPRSGMSEEGSQAI